jgi:cytokinin trans-hydroxylase
VHFFGSLLPTPLNIQILKTQMTISSSLREIIQSRRDTVNQAKNASHGIDLLGLMLTAASEETAVKGGKVQFGMQALIDNCKTFFLAGHETTATLLMWTMMLLASHTTWQESAREEVTRVCGHGNHSIDTDMLSKLKTVC